MAALRVLAALAAAAAVPDALPIRVVEWNVYYKALDDDFGQAAIASSIDAAATASLTTTTVATTKAAAPTATTVKCWAVRILHCSSAMITRS